MLATVSWKKGAIPARLGNTYLCCQRHQARLTAPATALGVLLRRPSQAPISPSFTWPKGTSAANRTT
ncbi:hypothetical protein M5D96_007285 [Drosophila gunungcola]|uniref:Uncharacterized protein n=1 Tax=Drosophila gunungcola TaxID=103775 RepID=A0A9Q0BQ73_9MUSC|nr:hypothetical protein M5D96_007285 [Drosophila gunungcola]